MFGLDSEGPSLRSLLLARGLNPFANRSQRRLARDHYFRALYFLMRLARIAGVAEENVARFPDEEETRAAGKAAKISDVGKMADQQCIKAGRSELLPQFLLAREKIHAC